MGGPADDPISALAAGKRFPFRSWPVEAVPRIAIGVYTIWEGERLLYVAVAGRSLDPEKIARLRLSGSSPKGLFDRLKNHVSGRRSGDQFCVDVCDRLILPALTETEWQAISGGTLSLDALTRTYIRERLSFAFVILDSYADARKVEEKIRAGGPGAGGPLLNASR